MTTAALPHHLRDVLNYEVDKLLVQLGGGVIDSVTYDTSWVVRLQPYFPYAGFEGAIHWLRHRQSPDGSWGGDVLYHHDRFICTLAAMVALHTVGHDIDRPRVQQAENFLWRTYNYLSRDPHDTIGFPVLAVSLLNEATQLGLDVPSDLYCDVATIEKKLNMVGRVSSAWRYNTMSFSLEAAHPKYPEEPNFLEANGSVGTSPAATAAMLIRRGREYTPSLNYLRNIANPDGGIPNVGPIDTFEIAWSLNLLRLAGAITPDDPEVKRATDALWDAWSQEKGIGFSSFYSLSDLDDTATTFAVLRWAGYPASADVFLRFEVDDHFLCFPAEADPSLGAHVRALMAIRMAPEHPKYEAWIEKMLHLIRRYNLYGRFYFDKWHSSPYYMRSTAIYALHNLENPLATECIHWMIRTQLEDGGWGYYGKSTAEETAYCLQALLYWEHYFPGTCSPAHIEAAAVFLSDNLQDERFPSLWIGKCLYTPPKVVQAAIAAALHSYRVWKG